MGSSERIEREREQHRRRRERGILSAAEVLFLEKGFRQTTIGDIARSCELTNAAIYLYFRNKGDLVLRIMTRISLEFGNLLEQAAKDGSTGADKTENILRVYDESFRNHRDYHVLDAEFNIMYRETYPDSSGLAEYFQANSRILDILTASISLGRADGSLRSSDPPESLARMILNVINSYVEKISLRAALMEREQGIVMAEELHRLIAFLMDGIRR